MNVPVSVSLVLSLCIVGLGVRQAQSLPRADAVLEFGDRKSVLEIESQKPCVITWKYRVPQEDIIFVHLQLRKDNMSIDVIECDSHGKNKNLVENSLSSMVKLFSLQKIILQNIPPYLNDYDIYLCCYYRKNLKSFGQSCVKYAKIKLHQTFDDRLKTTGSLNSEVFPVIVGVSLFFLCLGVFIMIIYLVFSLNNTKKKTKLLH